MNLLQLQDALKGLPDQELQTEMIEPSGQVPQYLIMTEMQRRKKMREEYNARPQPPGTVADQFKSEAQQGLAGALQSMSNERTGPPQQMPLPAPKPQGYDPGMARDTTRGFAGGGPVEAFQGVPSVQAMMGNAPQPNPGPSQGSVQDIFANMPQAIEMFKNVQSGDEPPEGLFNIFRMLRGRGGVQQNFAMGGEVMHHPDYRQEHPYVNVFHQSPMPTNPMQFAEGGLVGDRGGYRYISPYSRMRPDGVVENKNWATGEWSPQGEATTAPQEPDIAPKEFEPSTPFSRDLGTVRRATDPVRALESLSSGVNDAATGAYDLYQEYVGQPFSDWAKNYFAGTPLPEPAEVEEGGLASVRPQDGYNFRSEARAPMPTAAELEEEISDPSVKEGGAPSSTRTRPAAAGGGGSKMNWAENYLREMMEKDEEPGFMDIKESISEMEKRLEGQKDQDKWMGLANMGFAMASGESPYFATNVGQGGMAGTQYWTEADRARRGEEANVLDAKMDLAQAREAARRGDLSLAAQLYSAANDAEYKSGMLGLKEAELELTRELGLLSAGGIGDPDSMIKMAGELRQRIDDATSRLSEDPNLMSDAEARAPVERQIQEYTALYNSIISRLGGVPGGGVGVLEYDPETGTVK